MKFMDFNEFIILFLNLSFNFIKLLKNHFFFQNYFENKNHFFNSLLRTKNNLKRVQFHIYRFFFSRKATREVVGDI
jgi:hypothetical protein